MYQQIALGGADQNYNSRRSRSEAINCYIEANKDGNFTRVRRAPGLKTFASVGSGPIRGLYSLKEFIYVASRDELYRVDELGAATLLGNIGGTTAKVSINANGTDDNQLIIISEGNGYIYDDAGGFQAITDPDFSADVYVASLNQIFWLNRPDSNVFIGSDTADGLNYSATRLASAEASPDPLKAIAATKTNLWLFGSKTIEYWQRDPTDTTVPVRPVQGAAIDRGIAAQDSLAQWKDNLFWLANDLTVWQIDGSEARKISDINLEYAISGEGFGEYTGYANPELAQGFFIDHPVHKFYVLTFPVAEVTWVYDVSTGLWHKRESKGISRWRGKESVLNFNKVIVGDWRLGTLWEFDDATFTEAGEAIPVTIVTPAISDDSAALFISMFELNMEVGSDFAPTYTPKIQLKYSKDGGVTYKSKKDISIGEPGDRNIRVVSRSFGMVKRGFEMTFKIIVTEPISFVVYYPTLYVEKGV